MARIHILLIALTFALGACASTSDVVWEHRHIGACPSFSGDHSDASLERSYLAMALALEARGYMVESWDPDAMRMIANLRARQGDTRARWVIDFDYQGHIAVDLSNRELTSRHHAKVNGWYAKLERTYQNYRCRTLHWLRNRAQRRGVAH